MKKLTFLFAVILFQFAAYSQSFKDLYESMPQNDKFSNMMNLRHYQAANPDHAVAYFMLGGIYDTYMRETNPLVMFDIVESNYRQLETYYGLLKSKLDDKQARQDREYFGTVQIISGSKKAGLEDIVNEADKRLVSSREYFSNAKMVHDNYIRCINKYNECLFKYREILADYPDYKTLYLIANQKLINDIQTISVNFDSSLIYFNEYKVSCSKMTHLLTVNNYHLNKIETYRLEGLIEADFTLPVVEMWDFTSWAQLFIETYKSDILQIKTGLFENDKALSVQTEKLKTKEFYSDEMPCYRTEDKFQNLIGKYDHASICNELIDYRQAKIRYLLATRSKINQITDSSSFFLINKLWFFRDLANNKTELNQQADNLKRSVSIDNIGKYVDFFAKQYNGMDGFSRWCIVEKWDNDQLFDKNLLHLKAFIGRDKQQFEFTDSVFTFQKKKIAFGVQHPNPDSLLSDTLITTGVYPFKKKFHFLTGYEADKNRIKSAYIAKVKSDGAIDWIVKPKIENSITNSNVDISQFQVLDDSTCTVAASAMVWKNDSIAEVQPFISRYNWKGVLKKQVLFGPNFITVYFYADEINEQYLLVSESVKTNQTEPSEKVMKVCLYNFSDSLIWTHQFNLTGSFVDVVTINSNFLVTCNYSSFNCSLPDNPVSFKPEQGGFVTLFINREGKIQWINNYETSMKLNIIASEKISSNELNFIGDIVGKTPSESPVFYLLTNEFGEPVFTNLADMKFSKKKVE